MLYLIIENNVFGVSILTLIRKDHLVAGEAGSVIPRILRLLLEALTRKVNEEGILRVAGNKHKVVIIPIILLFFERCFLSNNRLNL